MENTKAKKVLIVVLIILLLACLGVIVYQYLKLNNTNKEIANSTTTDTTQKETGTTNTTTTEESNKTTEKVVVKRLVDDALNKVNNNAGKSACPDVGAELYLRVRAPKINIDTETVKKFNKEIYEKYNNLTNSTYKNIYSIKVTYSYRYIPEKDLLFIKIKESGATECATGTTKYDSYVYDVKNDKFLTVSDILKIYNISESKKDEIVNETLEELYKDYEDKDQIKEYKAKIKEIEKEKTMDLFDLDTNRIELYYRINLPGMIVRIGETNITL